METITSKLYKTNQRMKKSQRDVMRIREKLNREARVGINTQRVTLNNHFTFFLILLFSGTGCILKASFPIIVNVQKSFVIATAVSFSAFENNTFQQCLPFIFHIHTHMHFKVNAQVLNILNTVKEEQ